MQPAENNPNYCGNHHVVRHFTFLPFELGGVEYYYSPRMCSVSRDVVSIQCDVVGGRVEEYGDEGDGDDGKREQEEENKIIEKVINEKDRRKEAPQALECRDVNGRPPLTESVTGIFPGALEGIEGERQEIAADRQKVAKAFLEQRENSLLFNDSEYCLGYIRFLPDSLTAFSLRSTVCSLLVRGSVPLQPA